MTKPTGFDIWINYILDDEGPELNVSPDEPGGASRSGVSVDALTDFYNATYPQGHAAATIADVTAMTATSAGQFYEWFLGTMMLDQLTPAVAYRIADIEVNLGRNGGLWAVCLALGISPFPPAMTQGVISQVKAVDPAQMIMALSGVWLSWKHANAIGWVKYGNGWTNRRNKAHSRAIGLITWSQMQTLKSAAPPSNFVSSLGVQPVKTVWPLQSDAKAFFGDPSQGDWLDKNTMRVPCPWPLYLGGEQIKNGILIHNKCAASLARVLARVWQECDQSIDTVHNFRYDQYDGSYNYRPIRGGSILSMHSFAAAIDWDAADNQQHALKHLFTDTSPLIVAFKDEGWIWGGDWSPGSIDAMHVQAARVHP